MTQNPHYIDIDRKREFSEIISDTLTLTRQTIKVQLKLVLVYLGPLIFLSAAITTYLTMESVGSLSPFSTDGGLDQYEAYTAGQYDNLAGTIGSSILQQMVCWLVMSLSLCSIRQYRDGKGDVNSTEVVRHFRQIFFPALISFFVVGLIIAFSFIGIIIGALIALVFLALQPAAIVFEDLSVFQAIRRSFELVQNSWWFTLGVILLLFILQSVPVYAVSFVSGILIGLRTIGGILDDSIAIDVITAVFVALAGIAQNILFVVMGSGLSVLFAHHKKRVSNGDIYDRVQSIGSSS